ncbi:MULTISPECIES: phage tail tube protein [unclassified Enterococcus]|uniref:phage tail tube protein n=1 Tax=unclassified Enterococcus TaxID=2608891 RepID=UPI000A33D5E6|nr:MULTISPECIES: hypothetical protein [unclassified Enterococcus]MBO0427318.1 phage tail protein [Enterococcus faecium]OTO34932.1 hypothetical protein A5870_002301 [Enterococcus sp. 2G9_DIV0600]OTO37818.1 hypothetical protein A5871_002387 [Enterococcus sp. 2F9_DIV0599]
MARKKNALRQHFVAEFDPTKPDTKPIEGAYKKFGRYVTSIEDDGDVQTEDYSDYDGDGSISTDVTGVTEKWNFSGYWDPDQEAQQLVKSKKRAKGDDRKVWHKVIETDGTTIEGVGTLSEKIVAGSGEASDYEEFSCAITFDTTPSVTDPVAEG